MWWFKYIKFSVYIDVVSYVGCGELSVYINVVSLMCFTCEELNVYLDGVSHVCDVFKVWFSYGKLSIKCVFRCVDLIVYLDMVR